jgi:phenylacetic acid degradation operon negative regulatory protein
MKNGSSSGDQLKPRSIVFDLFGEYIRYDGGEAPMRALVNLLGAFDISADAARVVMSRLRAEGWFETRRVGRESRYALTARAWDMLDEGRPRIFERRREPWSGEWCMVTYSVPEAARQTRDRLRKRMAWLGFGPLAPSTWICPHDKRAEVVKVLEAEPEARFDVFMARSLGLAQDRDMVRRCWDLDGLNQAYGQFLHRTQDRLGRLQKEPPVGAEALVERMQLIHEYRLFPFQDPDLPLELLPAGWFGRQAHDAFLTAVGTLRPAALEYYRGVFVAGQNGHDV